MLPTSPSPSPAKVKISETKTSQAIFFREQERHAAALERELRERTGGIGDVDFMADFADDGFVGV